MRATLFPLLSLLLGSFAAMAQQAAGPMQALPASVNSAGGEHSPVISIDGSTLWYLRDDKRQNVGENNAVDIWVSYRLPSGGWSRGVNMGAPINSRQANHLLAVNASGNRLYLRQEDENGQEHFYYSQREGRHWTGPFLLPTADTFHLGPYSTLSTGPDDQVMILSQAATDQPQQYDLYFSLRDPWGVWSRPVSLGSAINTPGQERKVVLAPDGRTLYFSSNGYHDRDDTDIYVSLRRGEGWTEWSDPVPLGAPFSSPEDDDDHFALSAAADYLYFSRDTAAGRPNLFRAPLPDEFSPQGVCLVRGEVPPALMAHAEDLVIHYFPEENTPERPKTLYVEPSGHFSTILSHRGGQGLLLAWQPGYFPQSYQLPDTTVDLQMLDRESERLIAGLEEDRSYQNREEDIIQSYGRLAEVEKQILDIDQQLSQLNNPPPEWWPSLDPSLLQRPAMQAIEERYHPYFSGQAANGLETTVAPDSLAEVSLRMERVRRRFLRAREQDEQGGELPPLDTDPLPAEEEIGNFASLCQVYWNLRMLRETPRIRYRLEREMLETMLREEEREKRPDATKLLALQARQATVSERIEDLEGRPPMPLPEVPEWRDSLRNDLAQQLDPILRESLEEALKPRLEEYILLSRRKYNRNRQRQVLQDELDQLLATQIQQEQEAMERVPPDTFALLVEPPPYDSMYREQRVRVDLQPFGLGTVHLARGIQFYANSAMLQPNSYEELDFLVQLLKDHPTLGLSITCHTHSLVTHVKAQSLTKSRARTLSDYFENQGIPAYRLRFRGIGKLEPLRSGSSPHALRTNQRIAVRVFLAAG